MPVHQRDPSLLNTGESIPEFGIAKVARVNWRGNIAKASWHWVAVRDARIIDGSEIDRLNWGWRISSYLPVIPTEIAYRAASD